MKIRSSATNSGSWLRVEQQHPVGADPEMRVAEPLDPLRVELPGKVLRLEDQVVVAQRLPLLEFHRRQPIGHGLMGLVARGAPVLVQLLGRPRAVGVGQAGAVDRRGGWGSCAPGELAAGVVAGALLHRLDVAGRAARRSRAPCGRCATARARRPAAPPPPRRRRRSPRSGRRSARRAGRGPCRGRRSSSGAGSRGDQSSESLAFRRRLLQRELGERRAQVEAGAADHDRRPAGRQRRVDLRVGQRHVLADVEGLGDRDEPDQPVLEPACSAALAVPVRVASPS